MKDDEGIQDELKKVNTLPLQLAVSILSNSKRITNNFIHAIDGFYTNDVFLQILIHYISKVRIGIN